MYVNQKKHCCDGRLTIFVNCKILDDKKQLLGVTGVGVEMNYIQALLEDFENNYQLEAFLVDSTGLVQAHTNVDYIEKRNINDEPIYQKLGNGLYDKQEQLNLFEVEGKYEDQYVISHYIKDLDWYLIVRKDTSILAKSFNTQLVYDLLIILAVLVSILVIVGRILKRHAMQLEAIARKDTFGILDNRKSFDNKLKETFLRNDIERIKWSVFILDLDHFKQVNDTNGHIQGDKVLKHVMSICQKVLSSHIVTRWGGDEFSGILYADSKSSAAILEGLRSGIESDPMLLDFNITISIGVTEVTPIDTEDSIIKRADQALYQAKTEGKNRVVCI